jgi:LuxR family maltose regulon positive regulatory protein
VACLLRGASAQLAGRREDARAWLEEGARRGASSAPGIQVLCQAQLVLLAIERDDWVGAEVQAARAKAQVERISQGDCPLSALVYGVSADVLARFGRVEEAQRDIEEAVRLLGRLSDFAPWYGIECRIVVARAALRLSDSARARQLLAEAQWNLRQVPDASVMREWFDETSVQLKLAAGRPGSDGWSLTTAELRVLQFLPTHLSFPEIASRLYVSANTVKTHARAVYRKLDASSRGEAVLRAREAGLLDRYGRQASSEAGAL